MLGAELIQVGFAALWVSAIAVIGVVAVTRGGWPEISGAYAATVAWLVSLLIAHGSPKVIGPHLGLFAVDVSLLIALLIIGFCSSDLWPLIASGFQLCGVFLHIVVWVQPDIGSPAYFAGLQVTSFSVLCAITSGVISAGSPFKPWRVFLTLATQRR